MFINYTFRVQSRFPDAVPANITLSSSSAPHSPFSAAGDHNFVSRRTHDVTASSSGGTGGVPLTGTPAAGPATQPLTGTPQPLTGTPQPPSVAPERSAQQSDPHSATGAFPGSLPPGDEASNAFPNEPLSADKDRKRKKATGSGAAQSPRKDGSEFVHAPNEAMQPRGE